MLAGNRRLLCHAQAICAAVTDPVPSLRPCASRSLSRGMSITKPARHPPTFQYSGTSLRVSQLHPRPAGCACAIAPSCRRDMAAVVLLALPLCCHADALKTPPLSRPLASHCCVRRSRRRVSHLLRGKVELLNRGLYGAGSLAQSTPNDSYRVARLGRRHSRFGTRSSVARGVAGCTSRLINAFSGASHAGALYNVSNSDRDGGPSVRVSDARRSSSCGRLSRAASGEARPRT